MTNDGLKPCPFCGRDDVKATVKCGLIRPDRVRDRHRNGEFEEDHRNRKRR